MKKAIFLCLLCMCLLGCVPSAPVEYELTMFFDDGSTKVFVGRSVYRDNNSGVWSYIKADGTRKTFVGEVKVKPVLKSSPRSNFETLAEDPQGDTGSPR